MALRDIRDKSITETEPSGEWWKKGVRLHFCLTRGHIDRDRQETTAKTLGRESTLRVSGRPKKTKSSPIAFFTLIEH